MQKVILFALSVFFILNSTCVFSQVDLDKMLLDINQNQSQLDSIADLYTSDLNEMEDSSLEIVFQNLDNISHKLSDGQLLEINKRRFAVLEGIDRAPIWNATIKLVENRPQIDSSKLAFAINSLGEWYAHIKEKELAKEQFIKVIALFPENSLELELGYSHNNLGTILNTGGDPGASIPFLKQAIRIFSHHLGADHQYISVMLNNIGMAYGNLKQLDKQKEYLLRSHAIRIEKYENCHDKMFEIRHNLALCLTSLKEYNKAEKFIRQEVSCLSIDKSNSDYRFIKLQTILVNIEIGRAELRDYGNLERIYLNSIKAIEKRVGKRHSAGRDIYNNTGVFYYDRKMPNKAVEFFEMAVSSMVGDSKEGHFILPQASDLKNISKEDLVLFTNLASSYFNKFEKSGNSRYLKQSYEAFLLCDQIAEILKIRILEGNSREVLKEATRHSFIMSNRTAYHLYQKTQDEVYKGKLFENCEKIKSWELLEKYSYTNQASKMIDDEVASRINEIKDQLLLGENSNISDSLRIELNFLLQKMKVDYSEYYQTLYGNQTVSLDDLQALCALKEEQWLIYCQLPDKKFTSLYVNKDTSVLADSLFNSTKLASLKSLLFENLANKDWNFVPVSEKLYSLLIAEQRSYFRDIRLVFQPHHQLLDLPFEILIDPKHHKIEGTDDYTYHYLLHDYDISYMHSSSIAFQLRNRFESFMNPFFYAPVYSTQKLQLEWNKKEVEYGKSQLGGALPGKLNKGEFLDYLSSKDHLHFAGHVFANERIDSTFILLDNDSLFLNEMVNEKSAANLLVLSGCDSGIGKSSTEALISPAYALTFAGSPNVIASLWKTRDEYSHKIFKRFYSHLREGESSISALRKSKIDYLKGASIPERHPIYWASFTHYGNEVVFDPRKRKIKIGLRIGFAFLLLSIAVFLGIRVKNYRLV